MTNPIIKSYRSKMLSFRQLQYLVAVADLQHFRRAASFLHVSQPALSVQLQKLEDQLGVKLVERGNGPVHLTPTGREIVARARKLLLDLKDLETCARRGTEDLVGTVSFGVSPTIGPYLLPGIVGVLKHTMPDLRLYIREGIPAEQLLQLRSGSLDMVITSSPKVGADLHVQPLFDERLFLVAPPEHHLSQRPALTRADLISSQVLSIDPRYPFHRQTTEICEDLGLELLNDYAGTSLDSLCQMCASGLGLAVLPELYLRSEVGGRNVVTPLAISDWSAKRSVTALWRANSVCGESYVKITQVIEREASLIFQSELTAVGPGYRGDHVDE